MNGTGCISLTVALLALCGAVAGGVQAQAISTVSPFLPQNGTPGAVTENSPIELRGIMAIPGGSLFGLYDPVKKQGGWVKLNEAGRDFTVRTYDAANDAVTVEYQGRVLSLALKTAKIESMPAMAMVQPPRPPVPGPQLATAPSVDEAKRLEAVAAEVQRRRQQRQAAMQQAGQMPGQPQPPGMLPPMRNGQPVRPGNGIGGGGQ
jgi:hypothetical protein